MIFPEDSGNILTGELAWTSRTIPSGDYNGITWDGSLFVAVGYASVCITSPAN